jgi:hypothetical protein
MESPINKPVWKEPTWEPLERIVGRQNLLAFMYMGEVQTGKKRIFLYKHIVTRFYLNLDEEGRAYRYTRSGYQAIPLDEVLAHVWGL